MLSAWNWSTPSSRIVLAPMNASVSADAANNTLTYSFVGAPAVSASKTINVATDSVLAVDVALDRVPPQTTLTLGWVGTRDRRKPSNLAVSLPPSDTPQTVRVLLRGHSHWRDNITQVALVLLSRPGNPPITLSDVRWVSATPADASFVAWKEWFASPQQLKAPVVSQRVLPLALLFGIAALIAVLAITWLKRNDPPARRDALIGVGVAFVVTAIGMSAFSQNAWVVNLATLPWMLGAAAVYFSLHTPASMTRLVVRTFTMADLAAVAFGAIAVLVGGIGFAWVALVVAWALGARHFQFAAAKAASLVFFLPALAIGAAVQAAHAKQFEFPAALIADPSSPVAMALHAAAALPALFIVMFLMHWAWPRTIDTSRRDPAAIAVWLTALGTFAGFWWALAQSKPAAVGVVWVLLPLLVAVVGWLVPKLLSPLVAANSVATMTEKSEVDLSSVVRQLFDGAAASFEGALASEHSGTALAPLKRMREIAPASATTHAAELRYALIHGETAHTRNAYARLRKAPNVAVNLGALQALLNYADRHDDFDVLRERASQLDDVERKTYYFAYAELLRADDDNGPLAALAALAEFTKNDAVAVQAHSRAVVELHFLNDDWRAAQAALPSTGIALQSILGEAYVARLGLRATHSAGYAEKIQKLVTWQNTMGAAHAAMGELLLTQGNPSGAKARFLLAVKLDAALWPLKWRVQQIERAQRRTVSDTENSPAVAERAS